MDILFVLLQVRNILGDFAVLIAIVVMVGVDAVLGLPTPKLTVPDEFKVSATIKLVKIFPVSMNIKYGWTSDS